MEPWRCGVNWRMVAIGSSGLGRKLSLNIETSDIVNFNVTSTMLELYHLVKSNWSEDYYSGIDGIIFNKLFMYAHICCPDDLT